MNELSKERIEEILHTETLKTEDSKTLLRAIYNRYMHLYEEYFADIDKLNDKKIAQLKKYHEETNSLVKYYYLDIPMDVCSSLNEFDRYYSDKLLGALWHELLFDSYDRFKAESRNRNKSEEELKARFTAEKLASFYEAMDTVFRDSFGSASKTMENTAGWLKSLFFNNEKGEKK